MNMQLDRLDGILEDLRKNKKYLIDALGDVCKFVPSHDAEGDCGTMLAFRFDDAETACKFSQAESVTGYITLPINTGKHIYKYWDCILEKRGALHPLMDPFKMEANKDIIPDYSEDMCPDTLDKLSKAAYLNVKPDWTKEEMDQWVEKIKEAMKAL